MPHSQGFAHHHRRARNERLRRRQPQTHPARQGHPARREVYRIHGPFLFGATDKFADILAELDSLPPIVIMRWRNLTAIDATGLGAIRDLADTVHASGRSLLLYGARERPAKLMHQAEFERHAGSENICPGIADALQRAATLYQTGQASTESGPDKETPALTH